MAHLLGADAISLAVGTRTLLDSVSLGIDAGMRVGVGLPSREPDHALARSAAWHGRCNFPSTRRTTSAR